MRGDSVVIELEIPRRSICRCERRRVAQESPMKDVEALRELGLRGGRGRHLKGVDSALIEGRRRISLEIVLEGPIAEGDADALERGEHKGARLRAARDVGAVIGEPDEAEVIIPRVK